ncbi:DUF3307 domain-containing protein [Loktanella sp. D2R18]|uniref:DUF3307 domain-containing protein n=1 Tax=Rhodobacterales TaxID=204455 RepID=UPI000DE8613C|nr:MULTISPECIES: DUF3307 domain-containing protein [Rhodobacterales]MDO6592064.1 DUF3307 domain-containing protein [Yoonia sp. 1_MG-2023]RBW44805.1 DUF3307 domain-containing protein [Loktanella sp. D2R18]
MFETLAALFFAHILADYVLQTERMVMTKHRPLTLLTHTAAVYATAGLALGSLDWWIAVLAALHLLIDIGKTLWVKNHDDGAKPHLMDQCAHLITIAVIAASAPDLWGNGIWAAKTTAWAPQAMLLIAGAIYTTRAGGFAVGKLMGPFAAGAPAESLPAGGMMIGQLERGLIYLMFIAGLPAGIGFLIAAKSILRFDAASKNAKAEYVIIGTLASFSWAIAISILTLAINNGLNGAPLLEIMPRTP